MRNSVESKYIIELIYNTGLFEKIEANYLIMLYFRVLKKYTKTNLTLNVNTKIYDFNYQKLTKPLHQYFINGKVISQNEFFELLTEEGQEIFIFNLDLF